MTLEQFFEELEAKKGEGKWYLVGAVGKLVIRTEFPEYGCPICFLAGRRSIVLAVDALSLSRAAARTIIDAADGYLDKPEAKVARLRLFEILGLS
jgi:hypothetical protein